MELLKFFSIQWEKRKRNRKKIVLLARRIFNSIENIISKFLRNHEISHENFTIITSEKTLSWTTGKHQNVEQSKKWYINK